MAEGAFVLPAGVKLTLDGGDLSIENPGDIVIEGTPAQPLKNLVSTSGNVTLTPAEAVTVAEIRAEGTVRIAGKVTAKSVSAARIEFEAGTLTVEVLNASESIQLSGKKLSTQVVVAPRVEISSTLKGRATAIQSDSAPGAHMLKGGFSLSEFVDLIPGAADLLAAHGIEVSSTDEDDDDDDDDLRAPGGDNAADDSGAQDSKAEHVAVADENTSGGDASKDTDGEFVALVDENKDGSGPGPAAKADEAGAEEGSDPWFFPPSSSAADEEVPGSDLHAEVKDAYAKVVKAYGRGEPPPPVRLVGKFVEEGNLDDLKLQVNAIWADLIKFHAANKDQRMPNKLGPLFESIQLALRRLGS